MTHREDKGSHVCQSIGSVSDVVAGSSQHSQARVEPYRLAHRRQTIVLQYQLPETESEIPLSVNMEVNMCSACPTRVDAQTGQWKDGGRKLFFICLC